MPQTTSSPRDQYRQLRGLIVHFQRHWPTIRLRQTFRRALVPPFHNAPPDSRGTCRWCLTATDTAHLLWHTHCVHAYRAAAAQSLRHLWPPHKRPPCQCGQPADELDHDDALAIAWTSGNPRRIIRAYTLNNLIWLCRPCHRYKTTLDMRLLSDMRRKQVCLMGRLAGTQDKLMGVEHWPLAEGGLATKLRRTPDSHSYYEATNTITMRRGPVTYRPEAANCPRCLTALERTPNPPSWSLRLPANWHLDEPRAVNEATEKDQRQLTLL